MSRLLKLQGYRIELSTKAEKDLKKVPKSDSKKIAKKLHDLTSNDDASLNIKRLVIPKRELYRIRIGDYRAIFTIKNDVLVVLVVTVGHRKRVYDFLKKLQ